MAFDYFRKQKVDIAVIEVGLGGRLDSTNIISPEVSVITNISLDHTALLGNSISLIAAEKAGIIKAGIPVVIGETHPESVAVFTQKAAKENAPIVFADQELSCNYSMLLTDGKQSFQIRRSEELCYPDLQLDLPGSYQRKNILAVLKAVEILHLKEWNISHEHIYAALKKVTTSTGLMGRWQIIGHNPLVVCDTGHNEAGIRLVVEQIRQTAWKNLHIVFGIVNDKSIDHVLDLMPREATYYFTKAKLPRALDEADLQKQASLHGLNGEKFATVQQAYEAAKQNANEHDMIYIGGSTFVVAEIL